MRSGNLPRDMRSRADSEWQKEFEEAFPYEETPDQLTAIADIKRDMESPVPMDRLVCGDVGYGKTEVAMRAAFKAVGDGKQVAVLAPTTVLCLSALRDIQGAFLRLSGEDRHAEPLRSCQRAEGDRRGCGSRSRGYRDRHASDSVEGREVSGSRPDDRRRRAAIRRGPQGTTEANPDAGGRRDDDGDADPAHA